MAVSEIERAGIRLDSLHNAHLAIYENNARLRYECTDDEPVKGPRFDHGRCLFEENI